MFRGEVVGKEPRQTMTAVRLAQLGAVMTEEGPLDFAVLPMNCNDVPAAMERIISSLTTPGALTPTKTSAPTIASASVPCRWARLVSLAMSA